MGICSVDDQCCMLILFDDDGVSDRKVKQTFAAPLKVINFTEYALLILSKDSNQIYIHLGAGE